MKKILINCSNLHKGGGVAVATSFLSSLLSNREYCKGISVLVSSSVDSNIRSLGLDTSYFLEYTVKDFFGISSLWSGLHNYMRGYEIIFTVFGPAYFLYSHSYHIFGFAQPAIAYPINSYFANLPFIKKIIFKMKYFLQSFFFGRADEIIVELESVKKALLNNFFFNKKKIHVVNSAVDDVFFRKSSWGYLDINKNNSDFRLGIISRNYPHKNLHCLPIIKKILIDKYNLNVEILVTFTGDEWIQCDDFFRSNIINIGPLKLNQCPTFYQSIDGVVFPTLLECFSAVTIESMIMKKPLFASDLPFIRDCCSNHAFYFNPLNSESIADSIYHYINMPQSERNDLLNSAHNFARKYQSSLSRSHSYISIIDGIN